MQTIKSIYRILLLLLLVFLLLPLEHRASVKRFVSLQFFNLRQSVGLLGRVINSSQARYLTQTQNKHRQTSKLWVGFEPTIPVFERAKTFHALDCAATVIGYTGLICNNRLWQWYFTDLAYFLSLTMPY
jgi:hypothetical protein